MAVDEPRRRPGAVEVASAPSSSRGRQRRDRPDPCDAVADDADRAVADRPQPSPSSVARFRPASSRSKCARPARSRCAVDDARDRVLVRRERRFLPGVAAVPHDPASAEHRVAHGRRQGPKIAASSSVSPSWPTSAGSSRSSTTRSAAAPAAIAPVRRPHACAPPAAAASHIAVPIESSEPWCIRLRRRQNIRCEYSSWRNSANGSTIALLSLPTPQRPSAAGVRDARERAVAEVRLGRRGDARHRTARRERPGLALCHVRRVHEAPARVDAAAREQPFDRALAGPGDAFLDLARLLGDVDVHRRGRRRRGNHAIELFRRHRAQAVRRDADDRAVGPRGRRDRLDEPRELVGRRDEATLRGRRRRGVEAAVRVVDRQQRDREARATRGREHAPGQLGGVRETARRRRRGARSGTRRRCRSRPSPSRRTPAWRSPRHRRDRGARGTCTSPGATSRSCPRRSRPHGRCVRRRRAGTRANARWASPGSARRRHPRRRRAARPG